jgi:hypothetical protein
MPGPNQKMNNKKKETPELNGKSMSQLRGQSKSPFTTAIKMKNQSPPKF